MAETGAELCWHDFAGLGAEGLYQILVLRAEVFVVEQQCPYLDPDGLDPLCRHLLARAADGRLLGCLRLVPPGAAYVEPSIGRVATAGAGRGRGLGKRLMTEALAESERRYPGCALRIGAQRYLENFYAGFGFVQVGEPYDEDGIVHLQMLRRPGVTGSD